MAAEDDVFKGPDYTTPQQIRLAQPNLQAFHSTGLISKKQRAQPASGASARVSAGGMAGHPNTGSSAAPLPHSANYQYQAHSSYPHLVRSGQSGTLHGVPPESSGLSTPLYKRANSRPVDLTLGSASSVHTSIDSSPSSHLSTQNRLNMMIGLTEGGNNDLEDDFESVRGYRSPLSLKTGNLDGRASMMMSLADSAGAIDDDEAENVFMGTLLGSKHPRALDNTPVTQRTRLGVSNAQLMDNTDPTLASPTSKRHSTGSSRTLIDSSPTQRNGTIATSIPLTPVSNIELMKSRLYTLYPRFLTLDYIRKLREIPSTSQSLALLTSPNSNASLRISYASSAPCSEAGSSPTMSAAVLTLGGADKPLYPPTRHSDTDDYFETNFRIIERLGEGSFAEAFHVESLLDGQRYAIKRTRTAYNGYKDRLKKLEEVYQHFEMMQTALEVPADLGSKFYRELILPSSDPPPRLVRLLQSWEQHGILYMQLELCSRGSLQTFLERTCEFWDMSPAAANGGSPFVLSTMAIDSDDMLLSSNGPMSSSSLASRDDLDVERELDRLVGLSEEQIWSMFVEIALGLRAIHARGKLHLDLKPANIFITEDWHLKIGDFGLAGDIPINRDAEKEGDRIYIAPEVLEGFYSSAADVFSLGLIVLEMAANVVLPENGSAWQQLRIGELCNVTFPPHISDSLKYLIGMMLTPHPDQRITLDQIFELPPVQAFLQNSLRLHKLKS